LRKPKCICVSREGAGERRGGRVRWVLDAVRLSKAAYWPAVGEPIAALGWTLRLLRDFPTAVRRGSDSALTTRAVIVSLTRSPTPTACCGCIAELDVERRTTLAP